MAVQDRLAWINNGKDDRCKTGHEELRNDDEHVVNTLEDRYEGTHMGKSGERTGACISYAQDPNKVVTHNDGTSLRTQTMVRLSR